MDELMDRFAREGYSKDDLAINGLLINPFGGCDDREMEALVRDFMTETGLDSDWTRLFRKGAYLAQNKDAFLKERDDGLTLKKIERESLHHEQSNRWDQPMMLYALVACCSLGAAIQGWDESAINQAQVIPAFLNTLGMADYTPTDQDLSTALGTSPHLKGATNYITDDNLPQALQHPSHLLGLVNSAPYLACAVIGCWLTDPLNRYLGRRGTIFFCCIISCGACVWQAFTNTWWHMFIARFALGLGIGPKSATVPIYASECTPKEIRGGVVMMWQIWTALGIMLGYLSGVVFQSVGGDLHWRLIVASPMVLPVIVCAYIFTLPESPRWLVRKGRLHKGSEKRFRYYEKAFRSLRRLRRSELQAARDMFLIYHTLAAEDVIQDQHNRWFELFMIRRNRNAVVASIVCMFFQQFCGVNVLAYYSTLLFLNAGFNLKTAGRLSLGFGIINFVFALPAIPLIDNGKFGRRSLLLITFPLMAIFQFLTGFAFLASSETVRKVLVTTGMYLFCIAYSPGEGPVPFVYASESMPLYLRDLGMSTTTAINWLFNWLLSITFPSFLDKFGHVGTFSYYAAWCIVGFFCILLFVPETAGYSLEELDGRFAISAKVHAKHSLQELRYWIKFYIMRHKHTVKPKLKIEYRQPDKVLKEVEPRYIPFEDEYGHPKLIAVTRIVDRS